MHAVAYTSVVNFVLGLPYRKGPGPYYLWMVQILVSFVGVGIIIGCAFSVPEIRDAYGCYSKRSFMELGALGVCPNSTLAEHSHAICQQKVGATPPSSHCQILPWAGTIGAGCSGLRGAGSRSGLGSTLPRSRKLPAAGPVTARHTGRGAGAKKTQSSCLAPEVCRILSESQLLKVTGSPRGIGPAAIRTVSRDCAARFPMYPPV